MKLRSLRLEPNGPKGWGSEELIFGRYVTELFGPNGCGKTPVIQSITYALGYPVNFREDVLAHCGAAALTFGDESCEIVARRTIGVGARFDATLTENGEVKQFYNATDYSKYILSLLGFSTPTLTSLASEAVTPYVATLLPIFYLDQDNGYNKPYHANTFIKDQYAEMMRLVFALPPKHSFDQKKLAIDKKKRLNQLDRLIVKKQEFIEELSGELGGIRRSVEEIDLEIGDVARALEHFKESKGQRGDAYSALDELISERVSTKRKLASEIRELQGRISGLARIKDEIEVEVNTLSLNEEARWLFSSFQDICSNTACGLFIGSSESYGKNLLYLRDQMKDLDRNSQLQSARVDELSSEIERIAAEISSLEAKRDALSAADETTGLVAAIGELTKKLIRLQKERRDILEINDSENAYVEFLNERERVQNELASLAGSSGLSDLRAIEIRSNLRERVVYWLDVLQTKNVPRQITIDSDFDVLFGTEKIKQIKGSTLTRVVLALRTAAFDLYLRDPSGKMRFFILDTPRQQDIERDVMVSYLAELRKLAVERDAQILFSSSNIHYDCVDGDREWNPTFGGFEQPMFLGELENQG